MTFPKFQCRLPSKEKRWELTRYNFCTPLSHTKRCAKAFIHRNPGEKVAFFMSRRHARYKSEEIAPDIEHLAAKNNQLEKDFKVLKD